MAVAERAREEERFRKVEGAPASAQNELAAPTAEQQRLES